MLAAGTGAGLVVWLPFQTPVAALLYQYVPLSAEAARVIVLAKDVVAAVATLFLLATGWRRLRWSWLDGVALLYVALVLGYALVPFTAGRTLPLMAVAVSVRDFVLPVELYILGRLVAASGLSLGRVVAVFFAASVASAAFTLAQYFFTSPQFWTSTIDLVKYVRDVQEIQGARDLWSISVLSHFGVGEVATFARAVGTFTHPVGTGHYFVVPLSLSVSYLLSRAYGSRVGACVAAFLVLVFALSVLVPISRGAWIAAAVSVVILGWLARRLGTAIIGLAVAIAVVVLVPPYSYAVKSALTATDASIRGHLEAIDQGIRVILGNPLGLGAGHADQALSLQSQPPPPPPPPATTPIPADAGSSPASPSASAAPGPVQTPIPGGIGSQPEGSETASEGVGESMYLSIWVTAGPLGLLAFLTWVAGELLRLAFDSRRDWMRLGIFAALVGLLVASAFASPLMRFTSGGLPWLLLGAAVGVAPPSWGVHGQHRGLATSLAKPSVFG